jgi:molybdopterin-guanine dinucleotide biosynthesis protein A
MGRDKLSLKVGDEPLILRACRPLLPHCEEILVVGTVPSAVSPALPPEARLVAEERPGRLGPLAGIEAGLTAARNPAVFVVAGDMPFLPDGLVRLALDTLLDRGALAVVPRHEARLHPLCAAYVREAGPIATRALDAGVSAARDFVASLERVVYLEGELGRFGDPSVFLMSVNTPEDLQKARDVCAGGGAR